MQSHFAVFGYGSLVNLATHRTEVTAAVPARLRGWRRVWHHRPPVPDVSHPKPLAFLSVERHESSEIDGLLLVHPVEDLATLDQREALYDRHALDREALEILAPDFKTLSAMPVSIYAAKPAYGAARPSAEAGEAPHLLRSYLDAVCQGYHHHFGETGVQRFLESTATASLPVLEDREDPVYPRAVTLSESERMLFERMVLSL